MIHVNSSNQSTQYLFFVGKPKVAEYFSQAKVRHQKLKESFDNIMLQLGSKVVQEDSVIFEKLLFAEEKGAFDQLRGIPPQSHFVIPGTLDFF